MRVLSTFLVGSLLATACGPPAAGRVASEDPASAPTGAAVGALAEAEAAHDAATAAYVELAAESAESTQVGPLEVPLVNWPMAGRVSSPFGPRWGGFHNGLDVAAPLLTPVVAAAPGVVTVVGKPFLAYGDTATIVVIVHAAKFATVYGHLDDSRPPVVRVGERVAAGQVIAYNGATGWVTGPHVHFITVVDGRAVDPRPRLP